LKIARLLNQTISIEGHELPREDNIQVLVDNTIGMPLGVTTMITSYLTTIATLVTLIVSCSHIRGERTIASSDQLEAQNNELNQFIELVEETLAWRTKAIEFYTRVNNKQILNSSDITTLHEKGTSEYESIRMKLYEHIDKIRWMADNNVVVNTSAHHTRVKSMRITGDTPDMLDGPSKTKNVTVLQINPFDEKGRIYSLQLKMGLAAALLMTDNFIVALYPYQTNSKLRRLINYDNVDSQHTLEKITQEYYDENNIRAIGRAQLIYNQLIKKESTNTKHTPTPHEIYISSLIESSITFDRLASSTKLDNTKENLRAHRLKLLDRINKLFKDTLGDLSKTFGNTVGLYEERKGLLTKLSAQERDQITKTMKPLDVLMEKTPFRLTDKFIPGHWGHVAIWTGNELELKSLGVWEHLPAIEDHARKTYGYIGPSFQELVKTAHMIIEALRPGVQINTLEHFLNIDDLAVISPIELSNEQKKEYLLHAFEQIGKDYDFNFDVETDERIVCSELAYVVFDKYDWPTKKTMGRYTISPDNVAVQATGSQRRFVPIMIYHSGKKINSNLEENYEYLLKQQYERVTF